eukprot:7174767-Prymnesium_polylepis.1
MLGAAHAELGQHEQAAESYATLHQMADTSHAKDHVIPQLLQQRMRFVDVCMKRGDQTRALEWCEKLWQEAQDHPEQARRIE